MKSRFSFANRTQWPLAFNELTRLSERLKKSGRPVINLTESNPTNCGFSYPKEKLLRALCTSKNLCYEPSPQGIATARQAVSGYYRKKNLKVSASDIFLTSSTSEGYSFLFRLLLNPGEKILVPAPSYPLFEFLARLNDCQVESYPLVYDDGWCVDGHALQERLLPQVRAVVLVNPNNPTSSVISNEERIRLNKICSKNKTAIICDEVFLDYGFDGRLDRFSLANNRDALTFVLSGISKTLALPQMKIGWIVATGPKQLVSEAKGRLEIISDTYLSVNTPSQNALGDWLKLQLVLTQEILRRIRQNRAMLAACLREGPSCQCLKADGGWYAVVRLPSVMSEEQWALKFLNNDSVFIHPGYFFDFSGGSFIVLSLLLPQRAFQEGVRRIVKRIKAEVS